MTQSALLPSLRTDRCRWGVWIGLLSAIGLGVFSFANAAAGVGCPMRPFAPLGPAFFAWQPDYRIAEKKLAIDGANTRQLASLVEAGRSILVREPLSVQPLHLGASLEAKQGNLAVARQQMRMAERITRRNAAVQFWLIDDALQAGDIDAALRRYDVVLRTMRRLHAPLLQKLVASLDLQEARSALVPYAVADNPWFPELLSLASGSGRAVQAAMLLSAVRAMPDTPPYRAAYTALVPALVREKQFDLLRHFYPRLPGTLAGGKYMSDPALKGSLGTEDYPPLRWVLADDADRSASIATTGGNGAALHIEAKPFTYGEAAGRIFLSDESPRSFGWTINQQGLTDGEARWVVRCLDSKLTANSSNLLESSRTNGVLMIPQPCRAAQLVLVVNGGTGATGPAFDLTNLRWLAAGRASAGE